MFSNFKKKRENKIKVIRPEPFQGVGAKFLICGKVPKSWLKSHFGIYYNISLELIDINGQTTMGTSINVKRPSRLNLFSKYKKWFNFSAIYHFSDLSVGWIKNSQGRMTIKLSGQNEKEQSIYIPIIVKQLEPKGGVDPDIIKKHGKIGEMIKQYEKDLKIYYEELDKIQERRLRKNEIPIDEYKGMDQYVRDLEMVGEILVILERAENFNKNYPFVQEDLEEKKLAEKYKDAIEWQGPFLGVAVGRMNGFEFMIYSNDHGKHFHVIHKGKGINARFSFPEIKLINYKNTKTSINSKEIKAIINFFKDQSNFKKLEKEFQRRSNTN